MELTVFSNTYADNIWALNPFRAENNKQHVGRIQWQEYISLTDPELVRRQAAYARKMIQETSQMTTSITKFVMNPAARSFPATSRRPNRCVARRNGTCHAR